MVNCWRYTLRSRTCFFQHVIVCPSLWWKLTFVIHCVLKRKKEGHSVLLHSTFHSIFPPITSHVESVKLAVDFYHSRLHHIHVHVTVSFSRFYVLNIEIWSLFSAIDFFVLWFQPIMNVILLLSNANDLL